MALVTAETENRLLIVNLHTGRITERIAVAAGPRYVAAEPGVAVVTSTTAGEVTLLRGNPLHAIRVFGDPGTPQLAETSPDYTYAYVTNDASGQIAAIDLYNDRLMSRTFIGLEAHHFAFSPDQHQVWVALGESARTIVILSTIIASPPGSSPVGDLAHPHIIGRFDPGFLAHDLAFSPTGRTVWVTSSAGPDVTVFSATDHRPLFRLPVGPPPQHVAFDGKYAYLTSGYGSTIEQVDAATGHVLKRVSAPYGSFELDAGDGYVATASLLNGDVAIYTPSLKRLRTINVAPATRDISITSP